MRRKALFWGAAFLLAFIVALAAWMTRNDSDRTSLGQEAQVCGAASQLARTNSPASNEVAVRCGRSNLPDPIAADKTTKQEFTIRICGEDLDANRVSRWKFRYRLFDEKSFPDFELEESLRFRAANRCSVEAQTNVDGVYELTGEGSPPKALLLSTCEPGMMFASEGDPGHRLAPNECGYLINSSKREITVRLVPSIRVAYSISYADGVAYGDNMAGLTVIAKGKTSLLGVDLKAGDDLIADIPSNAVDILVTARSKRLAFRESNEWRFQAPDIPVYEKLTIPRDPEQIVIVVHLARWTKGEVPACQVCRADGGVVAEGSCPAGDDWITTRVPGMGLDHCVEVRGPSGVWRSAFFQPQKGSMYEFEAAPCLPGTIRVRFVDVEGKLLSNSFIYLSPNSYPGWRSRENYVPEDDVGRSVGYQAEAGKTGVAELVGVPPGEMIVFLESFRCEVETRSIRVRSNQVTDLGDVVMKPATGRITLRLVNRSLEYSYYVWLAGPNGSGIIALRKDVKADEVVFENVARRKYTIQVSAGNGGKGQNVDVVFLPDGTAETEVDVKDLRPRANK